MLIGSKVSSNVRNFSYTYEKFNVILVNGFEKFTQKNELKKLRVSPDLNHTI